MQERRFNANHKHIVRLHIYGIALPIHNTINFPTLFHFLTLQCNFTPLKNTRQHFLHKQKMALISHNYKLSTPNIWNL
jgi:hypothetical protein